MEFEHIKLADNLSQILYGGLELTIADLDKIESLEEKEIAYGLICLAQDLEFNRQRKDKLINNLKLALSETAILAVTNLKGEIKEVNAQFIELTGYAESEWIGSSFKLINSDYHRSSYFDDLWKVINKGKVWQGEFRNVNKNGDYFWVDTRIFPIKDENDQIVEFWSVTTDITKLKEAELKLVVSEKRYRELFQKSANAELILKNNVFIECNDAAIEMLGYKNKTEFLNTHPFELSPEKQPDGQLSFEKSKTMHNIAYEKGSNRFEWEHVKSNGDVFPVEVLLTFISSENASDKTLHVAWRDMTSQKNDFKEIETQKSLLSVSKDRLELVMGSLEEVVWGRNLPDYQMQYVSDSVVNLYGFPMADWYENPNLWTDMIHPDDIKQVVKEGESLFTAGITVLEYRIITPDKEIKWISSTTRIIKSTDGTPFFMTGIAQDITAQKTAQEQLEQLNHNLAKNQKRLQSVAAEATAVKSAVDTGWSSIEFKPDGTILKANDNFISSLGYSSNEDLIGNHHKIFCEPDYVKSADYKSFWKNLADGKFQAGEFKRIRKDGSKIWINANYTPVKNFDGKVIKVIKISNDISEMVKLRTQSEAIAKELRHFLETANAPIFGIDANGKVNEWNQTSEKITGFKKEEVLGKNLVATYITKDYQKAVKLVLDNALKGEETANYEFPLFTKEGSRVMVLLNSSTRRNADGEIVGVLGVGQDITIINEYKENLEKKVKHRTIELEESLEREKELGKLKSSFVSTASHQFRTPLAAIQANSELLSMLARDVEQQNQEKCIKITNRITVEIARMTELMDDVLLLGKSTSGSIDVKPQEINLVDFCQTLAKRFNDIQTDGRIINVATEGEPYNVYLDFKLLSQALSNLLSNAFKFSLGKSNPTLTVSFKPKGFSLIVEDFGIGIPKAEIANLFHPFFRANNATEIKGTGLGLSIAKEYIELNKGILTGKSTEGIGTKFEISFKK
jgi:PAS domain S-box-containing protein